MRAVTLAGAAETFNPSTILCNNLTPPLSSHSVAPFPRGDNYDNQHLTTSIEHQQQCLQEQEQSQAKTKPLVFRID